MERIANVDLRPADIPAPDASWDDIWHLALTFNGYQRWGAFDVCARIANEERNTTLTDLRTCLFFECQRWHHFGDDPDEEAEGYVRNLVAQIATRVATGDVTDSSHA